MTIHLPDDLGGSVRAEVESGHFASADEVVAEAVRSFLRQRTQAPDMTKPPAGDEDAAPAPKPIWEVFREIAASVPPETWDALPSDLSEQHDHYIYGTPKRPDA